MNITGSENNGGHHLDQELTPETLSPYLQQRFPNLEPASDEADLAKAVRALQATGRKNLRDVDALIENQLSMVINVMADLGGTPCLATSIIRIGLFAATPDPEQLTVYETAGTSISRLVESIQKCRAHLAEAQSEDAPKDTNGSAAEQNQTNGEGYVTQQAEPRTRQQSATAQSLAVYLQKRFPYRELAPGDFDYAGALYALGVAGLSTLEDLDALLARQGTLIENIESYSGQMNVQDIIRYSLIAEYELRLSPGPFVGGVSTMRDLKDTIRRYRGQSSPENMVLRREASSASAY